jgi:hypothetical protein
MACSGTALLFFFLVGNSVLIFAQMALDQWLGRRGFIAHVKATSPECISSHCIIHGHALAMEGTSNAMATLSDEVVKIVNLIKSSQFHSRSFSALCHKMSSSYPALLLHTQVLRGGVLVRVFTLRS